MANSLVAVPALAMETTASASSSALAARRRPAAHYQSLAFNGNTPYVAYRDGGNANKTTVKKFNGVLWQTVGNAGFSAGQAYYQSLGINSNTLYVAYRDGGNGNRSTVMKLETCVGNSNSLSVNAAGTYTVTVDLNGCTATASQTVTMNTLPTAGITGTAIGCGSDVTLIATGGGTYLWSGGNTPNQAENTFTTSNTYTVTVTDSNACTLVKNRIKKTTANSNELALAA